MGDRATVSDVAAAAGVSRATASRVLAGRPNVDPAMAARVHGAADRLGYRTNFLARALRTNRTGIVGLVVPSIANPYFAAAVVALESVLARDGRSLLLCDSRDSVETEARQIDILLHYQVDGLVVIPTDETGSAPAVRHAAAARPVVQIDRAVDSAPVDAVTGDDRAGVTLAVAHLLGLGRTSLAYVGAAPKSSAARLRLDGFRSAAGEAGRWFHLGDFSDAWGREAAGRLLAAEELPDGIVCAADVIAAPMLATLRDAGVDVPGRTTVVSYDDLPMARLTTPMLTSVHQPLEEMAEAVVELLDRRMTDPSAAPQQRALTPTLVVRGSTVPPTPGETDVPA